MRVNSTLSLQRAVMLAVMLAVVLAAVLALGERQ